MSLPKEEVKSQIEKSITISYLALKKRNTKVIIPIIEKEKPEMLGSYEGPEFYYADYWVRDVKVKS